MPDAALSYRSGPTDAYPFIGRGIIALDNSGHMRQHPQAVTDSRNPLTDDVRVLVRELLDGITRVHSSQWDDNAGGLSWSRWETAEHVADDLLSYGARLAAPTYPGDIPFTTTQRRRGAPDELVHAARESGSPGLGAVIGAAANLFVAVAEATAPEVTAPHVFGRTGAEGFAAMSVVELIVHGHDIFAGTDVTWTPDSEMCERVLSELFPSVDVDSAEDCFGVLLWSTGRIELPGMPLRTEWRWYN